MQSEALNEDDIQTVIAFGDSGCFIFAGLKWRIEGNAWTFDGNMAYSLVSLILI